MKEYEELAKKEYDFRKSRLPNKGTKTPAAEKSEAFKVELKELSEDLASLGNEFVASNSLSGPEAQKIKEINNSLISDFKELS